MADRTVCCRLCCDLVQTAAAVDYYLELRSAKRNRSSTEWVQTTALNYRTNQPNDTAAVGAAVVAVADLPPMIFDWTQMLD